MKSPWSRLKSWIRSVSRGKRLEADMESEIRFHLEARAADLVREGLGPQRSDAAGAAGIRHGRGAQRRHAKFTGVALVGRVARRPSLRF